MLIYIALYYYTHYAHCSIILDSMNALMNGFSAVATVCSAYAYRHNGIIVHTIAVTAGSLLANRNKIIEAILHNGVRFAPG